MRYKCYENVITRGVKTEIFNKGAWFKNIVRYSLHFVHLLMMVKYYQYLPIC